MKINNLMQLAMDQAKFAFVQNEVPVGAIIVDYSTNEIITATHNMIQELNDPTAHAEILAIRQATMIKQEKYLFSCDIYVTLEPCPMCAYAISLAKFRRLYFAAYDKKSGGVESNLSIFDSSVVLYKPEIYGGISEEQSQILLQDFFKKLRNT